MEAFKFCRINGLGSLELFINDRGSGKVYEGVLGKFLGDRDVLRLFHKQEDVLVPGENFEIKISCCVPRTISPHGRHEVVLGLYLSETNMEILAGLNAKALFFLPWTTAEGQLWVDRTAPTLLGEEQSMVPQSLVLNDGVKSFLLEFSKRTDTCSTVFHPSDEKTIKEKVRIFRGAGVPVDPTIVREWAIREGWNPRLADELNRLCR